MQVPYIPADAPFSGDQRVWLAGFLAGLHSRAAMGGGAPGAATNGAAPAPALDILFGTQTGNSEELANEAAALARTRGYAPRVNAMDAFSMNDLSKADRLLMVVSTYGEGEMPDNGQLFWEALSASTAPRLDDLNFAVLALGDTSYEHFCRAGKLVDTRLEQLGARRTADRLDCDVDYEDVAAAWLDKAIPAAGPAPA
ncbi:MAG: flavodoxin domain-containing protein, partial [Planctomycetota bacterium]